MKTERNAKTKRGREEKNKEAIEQKNRGKTFA